jgi:hypothetical protein
MTVCSPGASRAPAAKAARLASTPTPPRRMASSKASRGNGRAPLAHSAPNRAGLMTLALRSAAAAKSPAIQRCALSRQARTRASGSTRPSPMAVFSVME